MLSNHRKIQSVGQSQTFERLTDDSDGQVLDKPETQVEEIRL
jgi:hypothetical protein